MENLYDIKIRIKSDIEAEELQETIVAILKAFKKNLKIKGGSKTIVEIGRVITLDMSEK